MYYIAPFLLFLSIGSTVSAVPGIFSSRHEIDRPSKERKVDPFRYEKEIANNALKGAAAIGGGFLAGNIGGSLYRRHKDVKAERRHRASLFDVTNKKTATMFDRFGLQFAETMKASHDDINQGNRWGKFLVNSRLRTAQNGLDEKMSKCRQPGHIQAQIARIQKKIEKEKKKGDCIITRSRIMQLENELTGHVYDKLLMNAPWHVPEALKTLGLTRQQMLDPNFNQTIHDTLRDLESNVHSLPDEVTSKDQLLMTGKTQDDMLANYHNAAAILYKEMDLFNAELSALSSRILPRGVVKYYDNPAVAEKETEKNEQKNEHEKKEEDKKDKNETPQNKKIGSEGDLTKDQA